MVHLYSDLCTGLYILHYIFMCSQWFMSKWDMFSAYSWSIHDWWDLNGLTRFQLSLLILWDYATYQPYDITVANIWDYATYIGLCYILIIWDYATWLNSGYCNTPINQLVERDGIRIHFHGSNGTIHEENDEKHW